MVDSISNFGQSFDLLFIYLFIYSFMYLLFHNKKNNIIIYRYISLYYIFQLYNFNNFSLYKKRKRTIYKYI